MITKARPKYLEDDFFEKALLNTSALELKENELYFSSGRGALKFLFEKIKKHHKKENIVIAMQSFNCEVVMEAALQSSLKVSLLDIKLTDFSIDYNDLESMPQKPDMLLLTHYQGIPNSDYLEIAAYCKQESILLIDDIALTEGSSVNDVEVGSLADFSLRSFAFDKPFSVFSGGCLALNKSLDKNLISYLQKEFSKLKYEKQRDSDIDLKLLRFLHRYTSRQKYAKGLNRHSYIRPLIGFGLKYEFVYTIITKNIFTYYCKAINIVKKYLNIKSNSIKILKLRPEKIYLIELQRNNFKYNFAVIDILEKFLNDVHFKPASHDGKVYWNRYSLLDNTDTLKKLLNKRGIEAGSFAWPKPLHLLYSKNINVNRFGAYDKSEYAAKYIVNIPIWTDCFSKTEYK